MDNRNLRANQQADMHALTSQLFHKLFRLDCSCLEIALRNSVISRQMRNRDKVCLDDRIAQSSDKLPTVFYSFMPNGSALDL